MFLNVFKKNKLKTALILLLLYLVGGSNFQQVHYAFGERIREVG